MYYEIIQLFMWFVISFVASILIEKGTIYSYLNKDSFSFKQTIGYILIFVSINNIDDLLEKLNWW